MTNSSKEDELAYLIGFGILTIIVIAIKIWLAWIQINRFVFWLDIILIPVSFIGLVVSIICFIRSEWEDDFWLIVGGISILFLFFTLSTISNAYEKGYSDEAIQTKAELEKMLEDYTFILSIYTGEFKLKVQGMAMDEFSKTLCEAAPEVPCDQVISSYNAYQELVGWKNSADNLAKIWK